MYLGVVGGEGNGMGGSGAVWDILGDKKDLLFVLCKCGSIERKISLKQAMEYCVQVSRGHIAYSERLLLIFNFHLI